LGYSIFQCRKREWLDSDRGRRGKKKEGREEKNSNGPGKP